MTTPYGDLFIRDNFDDTGTVPVLNPNVSCSPDIIPYGSQTLTADQLVASYDGPAYLGAIDLFNSNNIYVRAKNLYPGATTGQIQLYWAPGNLLVQPSQWRNNMIVNNNTFPYAALSATSTDQVVPGDQPFNFVASKDSGAHFCFVATVTTPHTPDPIPATDFTSWDGFVDWVAQNPSVAWHNVDVVSSLPAQGYLASLAFENPDNADQMYAFQCTYSNLPAGSILRVWALPDAGSQFFGFDTGPLTITDTNGSKLVGGNFPAGYATTIFTQCQFPGAPAEPPPGVSLQTQSMAWVPATSDHAQKYAHLVQSEQSLGVQFDSVGVPAGGNLVPITAFTMMSATS
ncbi:MAG: hypothetical protein ABI140_16550 [Jatrophihabitantaceae bacterium]